MCVCMYRLIYIYIHIYYAHYIVCGYMETWGVRIPRCRSLPGVSRPRLVRIMSPLDGGMHELLVVASPTRRATTAMLIAA